MDNACSVDKFHAAVDNAAPLGVKGARNYCKLTSVGELRQKSMSASFMGGDEEGVADRSIPSRAVSLVKLKWPRMVEWAKSLWDVTEPCICICGSAVRTLSTCQEVSPRAMDPTWTHVAWR